MRSTWKWSLLLAVVAAAATSATVARAQAMPGTLEFVLPEGFMELGRDGVPTAFAQRTPELTALGSQPGLRLIAAKLADDGTTAATFQVTMNNRPFLFNETTIDQFAKELVAGFAQTGMSPDLKHKSPVLIAGRPSGRVALVTAGRRMLFYGVPEGSRTALLLYAASEKEFPTLFPAFQRSAEATHVVASSEPAPRAQPSIEPAAAPPSPPPAAAPVPAQSDSSFLIIVTITVAAALLVVLFLRRKRPS